MTTGFGCCSRPRREGPRHSPPRPDPRPGRRDAIASQLLRYRDERGDDWADIIDVLTMYPDARRRLVRVLGELEADHRTG